jgi:molybdate/tungstate transport system substrate-binding protein
VVPRVAHAGAGTGYSTLMPVRALRLPLIVLLVAAACGGDRQARPSLVVSHAGSLARPLRTALDSFTARTGIPVVTQSAGSLEAARRITELGDVPDIVALADAEVFPRMLMPTHVQWYAVFASDRIGIAYTPRSRHADALQRGEEWWRVLARPDVEVGRSDPALDPAGYRALMVLQLAGMHYGDTSLPAAVLARAPDRNVRPKSADLVALLQGGALDYAFAYESVARAVGLRFHRLPEQVDLGTAALAGGYARASVRIPANALGDSITLAGAPVRHALAVPVAAPHPAEADSLARFLLSARGLAIMRAAGLATIDPPALFGSAQATTRLLTPPAP